LAIGCLILGFKMNSQIKCTMSLKTDSCVLQTIAKKELVDLISITVKNNYQVQFIKHHKITYLKLIIKNDLGFGKAGSLVLHSNKKQYYTKLITLQPIDKTSAYFLLEINSSYLKTIADNGLTSIVFCKNSEFIIPKADSELVKQGATCFYEATMMK
jgi:hypothetical protein